jgi:hypothetical protein
LTQTAKAPAIFCLVCKRTLKQHDGLSAQPAIPHDGLIVEIPGNYGSRVYDAMGGDRLITYLCDDCLKTKATAGLVMEVSGAPRDRVVIVTTWNPQLE